MAKGGNSAATIQRIANQTQITLQKLVNSSNELQTRYNAQEAQKSRDWQTQMSKSAHQMEVEDLKKAGLNPVLSSGGSGAQSYTTSSASAQPESGASAVAALQGSQLGALSQLEASRMAAAATKKAAAVSAAAMRAAAAQSAAAQIYSANMGYKKAKYQSDTQAKIQQGVNKTNIQIANIGRGKSWSGLLDKWIEGSSVGSAGRGIVRRVVGNGISSIDKLINNPRQFYNDSWLLQHMKNGKAQPGFAGLNNKGISLIDKGLGKVGLTVNNKNRKLFYNAFILGNQSSANTIFTFVNNNHFAHQSKYTGPTGHR